MPTLSETARRRLPDSAFAYVDSRGTRRLPIHDGSHVRNALARFDQVAFEDDAARERARQKLLRAAKKHGIVPLGFFDVQLKKERFEGEVQARSTSAKALPRGRVTFLFTDIEGSTLLLRKLGDGYTRVLRSVRSILRSRVRASGGQEVDSRADEFFAVFRTPARAVEAALAIQEAMAAHRWPRGTEVCLRVGVHTGRPSLSDNGYVGIAVNTAARICAASKGSQILASGDTVGHLGRSKIVLRSMGSRRLRGLSEPVPLYEIRTEAPVPSAGKGTRSIAG